MKTEEEYQEAIDLNPEQKKAFAALKRAVKRCRDANVYFYQNLEHLGALNGDNVETVLTDEDVPYGNDGGHPACLQDKDFPSVDTVCSFADDNHFIKLWDE